VCPAFLCNFGPKFLAASFPFLVQIVRYIVLCSVCVCVVKGRTVPVQAWTGPEGSRSLRLPDFKAREGIFIVTRARCRVTQLLYQPLHVYKFIKFTH